MHWRTVLVLALVVAALAALVVVRQRGEQETVGDLVVPLFPGLEESRIRGLRIDGLERGVQLGLERDGAGRWFVTDPVAYPADASVVATLVRVAVSNRALEVDRDPAGVGLEPPRAVFEVIEEVGGDERRHTLELGAVDLGEQDVYVRVGGRVLLTRRNLETPLRHDVSYYRSKRIAAVPPRSVTQVHRRGRLPEGAPGAGRDLALSARLTPTGWFQDRPVEVRVDPAAIQLLVRVASGLDAVAFLDDDPLERLALYGLDAPALEFELVDSPGTGHVLLFGVAGEDAAARGEWTCMRKGYPHVFAVEERAVLSLATERPELYDYSLVRAPRDAIAEVELVTEERRIVLRAAPPGWRVTTTGAEEGAVGRPDERADEARVEELLGVLEASAALAFDPEAELEPVGGPPAPPPDEWPAFRIRTAAEVVWGGRFGAAAEVGGEPARQFQREGDSIVALVPESLFRAIQVPPEELWSDVVQDLDILVQARVELRGFGERLAYVRDERRGLWFTEGGGAEAPSDFTTYWLDPLLHLRALRWLRSDRALQDPIEVTFVDKSGHERFGRATVTLGRAEAEPHDERAAWPGGGRVECDSAAGRCEVRADLYAALKELLTDA